MGPKKRNLRKNTSNSGPINTISSFGRKSKQINIPDSDFSRLSNLSNNSRNDDLNNSTNNSSSDILKNVTPISSPSKRSLKNVSRLVNDREREISLVSDEEKDEKSSQEVSNDKSRSILKDFASVSKKRHERNQNTKRVNLADLNQKSDMITSSNSNIKTIITTQKIKLIKDSKIFSGKPVLLLNRENSSKLNVTYTDSLFFINTDVINFEPVNITNITQILAMSSYDTMTFILSKEIRGTYTPQEVEKRKQKEEKLPSNNVEKFKYLTIKVNSTDSNQIEHFIDCIRKTRSTNNEYFIRVMDHDEYMERTSGFMKAITKQISHSTHQGSEYGVLPPKKSSQNKTSLKNSSSSGIKISSPSSNINRSTSSANNSMNNYISAVSSTGYKPLGDILKDGLTANSFYGKSSRSRSLADRSPINNTETKKKETVNRSKYFEDQLGQPVKKRRIDDLAPVRRTRSQTNSVKPVEYANLCDLEDLNLDYRKSTKRELTADLKHNFLDGTSSKIYDTDYKCLLGGEWLNGTIIDFFTKYYREEVLKQKLMDGKEDDEDHTKTFDLDKLDDVTKKEFYVFNSYFFLSLNNTEKVVNSKWLLKNDCSVMKDYKYHIIPINLNSHWFGCILENFYEMCQETKTIRDEFNASLDKESEAPKEEKEEPIDYDELKRKFLAGDITEKEVDESLERVSRTRSRTRRSTRSSGPQSTISMSEAVPKLKNSDLPKIVIYVFDSLRNTHKKELHNIQQFLMSFSKQNFGIELMPSQIKMKNCQVVQQPNMNDCGVHLISNIRAFLTDPEKTLQYWNNSKFIADDQSLITYFKGKYKEASRIVLKAIIKSLLERAETGKDPYNFALEPLPTSNSGSDDGDEAEEDEDLMIIEDVNPKKDIEVEEKVEVAAEDIIGEPEEKATISQEEAVDEPEYKRFVINEPDANDKENKLDSNEAKEKKLDEILGLLDNDPLFETTIEEKNEKSKKPVSVTTKNKSRISADISGKLQSHKLKSDSLAKKFFGTEQEIEDEVFSQANIKDKSLQDQRIRRTNKRTYGSVSK